MDQQLELDLGDKRIKDEEESIIEKVVTCKKCGCTKTVSEIKKQHQENSCFDPGT